MTFWEKLITNPDITGEFIGSPLVRVLLGAGLLLFALHTLATDLLRFRKSGPFMHFSDHPTIFVITCVGSVFAAIWALMSARERFRMHE